MCERVAYTLACYMASRHLNNPISPLYIRVHSVLITFVIELIHAKIKKKRNSASSVREHERCMVQCHTGSRELFLFISISIITNAPLATPFDPSDPSGLVLFSHSPSSSVCLSRTDSKAFSLIIYICEL